jgi:hypothetical protein
MRLHSRSLAFAILLAGAILPNVSQAQVVPAIKNGGSQINVYGFYSLVNPDGKSTLDYPPGATFPQQVLNRFGSWSAGGGGAGADFRLGRFAFGQPALGARYTISTGNFATETTYMFGPELHYEFGKFHPYGDFMIGKGDIKYDSTNFNDDSIVYEFGGGVDYHLTHRWSIRMVDFQYQLWDLGSHNYPPGALPGQPGRTVDTTLNPYSLSFGVMFRVF